MTPDDTAPPSARIDLRRADRTGIAEAIYCEAKSVDQCLEIATTMLDSGDGAVLATRATPEQREALSSLDPDIAGDRTLLWRPPAPSGLSVAVVSAGTSDLPVAEECRITLAASGHDAELITDVGVAGLHRLTDALDDITRHDAIIAIAGMEGALPTVLAGLVSAPIIAVPTSAGYGTSLEGITALVSMMASCAPGIAVVGIDNGYGAACVAHRFLAATR